MRFISLFPLTVCVLFTCAQVRSDDRLQAVPAGVVPYCIRAADLNHDHRAELLVGGLDQDLVCCFSDSGELQWRFATPGVPLAIDTGDVDGDGTHEIVVVAGTSASTILVLDRAGRLVFEVKPPVPVYLLRVADIDKSGMDDIVVAGYMGKVLAYNFARTEILNKTVATKNFYRRMAGLEVGDVNGDGRVEIAHHGVFQAPGLIDSHGLAVRRGFVLSLQGGLSGSGDLDQDGDVELLFASLPHIRAETLSSKLWSANVGQKPQELAAEADGITKHPWEYGGTRTLAVGNFTRDEGLEIASFASDGKFNLLDANGKDLIRTKTKHPLLCIAAGDIDGDGLDEVLFGRLHDTNVYIADFAAGIQQTQAALETVLGTDAVQAGLDKLLDQIDAASVRPRRSRSTEKLHVLWGMEGNLAPWLFESTIRVVDAMMREMRDEKVEYAFMFTLKERGVRKFKGDGICAVSGLAPSQKKILDQCREWEEMGLRFYPVVSHMGVPTVMPETAAKIMEVAPNACQGYISWETMGNYPSDVWYDFLHRMDDLAQICVDRKKKILMAEEAPFWLALISDRKSREILLKPQYRSVLVPVLKTLMPQGDETDVGAFLGSWLAGEIDAWGITGEEDFWPHELGHYRGCPDDIVMRQEMMAVALGARYLMIESGHLYFEPVDAKGHYSAAFAKSARISREARRERMAIELFRKGILEPINAKDLLSLSSTGLAMSKSPKIDSAPMRWEFYGMRMFDGQGLVNMDLVSCLFNSGPHSLARNLYGSNKLMNGVFPQTPWGIVPIFGPSDSVRTPAGIRHWVHTDGEHVMMEGKQVSAAEAMPPLRKLVQSEAAGLPFRANGVFTSARRDGPNRYQVLLMDTEMFAPQEITTTLVTTLPGLRCWDEITSQPIAMSDNQVTITVPAGAWRLLRFEKR